MSTKLTDGMGTPRQALDPQSNSFAAHLLLPSGAVPQAAISRRASRLLFGWVLAFDVAVAAPTAIVPSDPLDPQQIQQSLDDEVSTSRTLRQLLESPPVTPPDADALPAAPLRRSQPRAAPRPDSLPIAEATPASAARADPQTAVDWQGAWTSGGDGLTPQTPTDGGLLPPNLYGQAVPERQQHTSAREEAQIAQRLLPPRLVEFIRANREWVLFGSAGVIGGLWLLGTGAARGRR